MLTGLQCPRILIVSLIYYCQLSTYLLPPLRQLKKRFSAHLELFTQRLIASCKDVLQVINTEDEFAELVCFLTLAGGLLVAVTYCVSFLLPLRDVMRMPIQTFYLFTQFESETLCMQNKFLRLVI